MAEGMILRRGGVGIDLSGTTATEADIRTGKTAGIASGIVTGTMPDPRFYVTELEATTMKFKKAVLDCNNNIPANYMKSINPPIFSVNSNVTIKCGVINESAFYETLKGAKYVKIDASQILNYAFQRLGYNDGSGLNSQVWISAKVTKIYSAGLSPFLYGSISKFYCEAPSKPSGWETNWNKVDSSNFVTTIWGTTNPPF